VLVSYVLRLVAAEAVEGRLVGEVQDVRTGRTRVFRGCDELATAVRDSQRQASDDLPEASPWPVHPSD
jgi:hypothetical protein